MEEILELFPTKEAFDLYWKENYVPVTYDEVKEEYEAFVKKAEKHIFLSDYEAGGAISRSDFMDNLTEDAAFLFQDTLTEVFYEKNPEIYENAFALFEAAQMEGKKELDVAAAFHTEYQRLYREFMLTLFDNFFME
jgi:hypothetical protein